MQWRFNRTQVLVAVGLVLNVVAALLTNFCIDQASSEANLLTQRQEHNQELIRQTWMQFDGIERKRELLLSLLSQSQLSGQTLPLEVQQSLRDDIAYWLTEQPIPALALTNLTELEALLDQIQLRFREQIDDYFLQNLELSEQFNQQTAMISKLRNLALFLQVLGLGLILARDLSR